MRFSMITAAGSRGAGLVLLVALLASCGQEQSVGLEYRVEVVRTSYGIPHITASDFGSLGYGEGFVAAEDHICNIADAIIVARGERAKYHGVGEGNKHLISDTVVRALGIWSRAEREFAEQSEDDRNWITGYTEGFNEYLNGTGRDGITSWCKGADWVKEISPQDLFARFQIVAQTAPLMAGMIVAAAPPEDGGDASSEINVETQTLVSAIDTLSAQHLGSNGWALGKDRTENGRGMLLGNPHYPWTGSSRFWEKHLIIPGKMNLYGSHLIGVPGVAIGFNESIGWTHTVSNSERVVFYTLDLVPGEPTHYYVDGEPREMTATVVEVPVLDENGELTTIEHTVWFSHYGPIVTLPNVPWSRETAITMRDANFPNQDLFAQWRDMGVATNLDEFKEAFRKWNAVPWVNTMATSEDGRALYLDGSNVGRLSIEAIGLWRKRVAEDELTGFFHRDMGLILLDGSDSRFAWQAHPEARIAGVVPFVEQPQQERSDYIFNANDSHWLTNVENPLTGYSPLFGPEETARTTRTRMNARLLTNTSPGGPAGDDGKFSLVEMQNALFSNRSLTAELLLDELLAACEVSSPVAVDNRVVELPAACAALRGYNRHLNLDSKGAVLFREWITGYELSELLSAGELFAVPFNAEDPVNTPRGLADRNLALQKLAEAVVVMERAGLDLDAALGDVQMAYRADEVIALHGGSTAEGVANVIGQWNYDTTAEQIRGEPVQGSKWLTDKGYAITYGTSFLLSLSFTDDGPVAEAFLTYGESGDPTSEHYTDQTTLFSQKQWRPVPYKTEDIEKDAQVSFVLVKSHEGIR